MTKQVYVRRKGRATAVKAVAIILAVVLLVLGFLEGTFLYLHATHEVFTPDYDKKDLSVILNKESLSYQDYDTLFMQTGLSKTAVDELMDSGKKDTILSAQRDFFANYKSEGFLFAPFTCCHRLERDITIAPLKKGDVIVSLTTHFSGYMLGHTTLVTDPDSGETTVSLGYVTKSHLGYVSDATNRESFVILRHKDEALASAAADYARENLTGLPYSISVGFTTEKFPEKPFVTQCGHLVWYAYKKQGIDLDSDGGYFVYPVDILNSDKLEVVQIFGMNPADFKK